jgi:endonuclease/exonuclease/phosphatase family metal-dependent hydrolase
MDPFKIITINTWKCDGDYYARMQILAEQLAAIKPAIVACQECFYSDESNADTLKFLADRLNMDYTFLPGRSKSRYLAGKWVDSESGLGILSVYLITAVNQFDLPPIPGDEDRKVQQAEITLPSGQKILVTNTHLTHLNNTLGRKAQAEALAEIVTANKTCYYHVICGDFNCEPDSLEVKSFMSKSGAIDCYKAGNGAEPRYSLANAFERNVHICVDHIFALPMPGGNKYPQFINSGVVLNTPDKTTGLYPSDHFGISSELVID